jgi:endonuclease-3
MTSILQRLRQRFPDARCELEHRNPLELLVATLLSAQCTDERVNQVTRTLFRKYRTAEDYANAPEGELEALIRPTGYYRQKARNLRRAAQMLVERHGGEVPDDFEALQALPGVARKTANIIMGTAFGVPTGVVVDTHVRRVAHRLGLSDARDPNRIEEDLKALIPREEWIQASHLLVFLGRYICKARRPSCDECPVKDLCPQRGVKA